jgi:hypothetical protein
MLKIRNCELRPKCGDMFVPSNEATAIFIRFLLGDSGVRQPRASIARDVCLFLDPRLARQLRGAPNRDLPGRDEYCGSGT